VTFLQPDEKVCPFCAETIKKAAIKCRYCRSDLPAEPGTEPPVVLVPPPASLLEGEAEPEDVPAAPEHLVDRPLVAAPALRATRRASRPVVGLILACVLLAGASVLLLLHDGSSADPAPGSALTVSSVFRDDAMSEAVQNAVVVLSYSYKTLVRDEENARAVMSPDFVADYEKVMAEASPQARKARLTLKATVVATSLVSIDAHRAVALLFVNAVSTAEDSPKQHVEEKRVLMTMTRKDGGWIVSKIDAF
jgi:hypothetical protein